MFIKDHMDRDKHSPSGWLIASVAFMSTTITNDTGISFWCKLYMAFEIWITPTA